MKTNFDVLFGINLSKLQNLTFTRNLFLRYKESFSTFYLHCCEFLLSKAKLWLFYQIYEWSMISMISSTLIILRGKNCSILMYINMPDIELVFNLLELLTVKVVIWTYLVTFTEEILNGKLHFLGSDTAATAVFLDSTGKIQWRDSVQKMKFSIKDFFSKSDQILSFLQIWSHLLKISLMENFIFCILVYVLYFVSLY